VKYSLILISLLLLFIYSITSCKSYDGSKSNTPSTWTKQFGTSSGDYGGGVTTDSSDNIYVTGSTDGGLDGNTNSGLRDIFLVKYNSDGVLQ
jgi:hypothetical protein